jgi:YHS domain-containing protein
MSVLSIAKRITAAAMLLFSFNVAAAGVHLNTDANDVAVKGYDVVSYFKSAPRKGKKSFAASYDNAVYYFASAENRDAFKADPSKYAPQFGGYCAMGVALNKKLDVDPLAYRVVDGKLYLNLNKQVQKKWLTDINGYISTAERNWNGINALTVAELDAE